MSKPVPLVAVGVLLSVVSSCSAGGDAYYLRFEKRGTVSGLAVRGDVRGAVASGSSLRMVLGNELVEVTGDAGASKPEATDLARNTTATLVLRPDGVYRTADFATFERVSEQKLDVITARGSDFIGAVLTSPSGEGEVFVSSDGGATWRSLGTIEAPGGFEGGAVSILGSTPTRAYVRVSADSDAGPNWWYTGADFEVLGDVLIDMNAQGAANYPPRFASSDGATVHAVGTGFVESRVDILDGVGVSMNGTVPADFQSIPRLHWVAKGMGDFHGASLPLAIGDDDHLWVGVGDDVYRSTTPFTRGGNQRADILRGPGCGERNTVAIDRGDDESVTVKFENRSGRTVLVRRMNFLYQWSTLGAVPDGEDREQTLERTNSWIVTDAADETCLGFFRMPGGDGTITLR